MDEYTADAFTHRNEAVPQLAVSQNDVDPPSSETDTGDQQNLSKKSLPPREKGQSVMAAPSEKAGGQPGKASIQDRLFSKYLYTSPVVGHADGAAGYYNKSFLRKMTRTIPTCQSTLGHPSTSSGRPLASLS